MNKHSPELSLKLRPFFTFILIAAEPQLGSTPLLTLHEVLAFSCPVPGRVIAVERQRGSTLFLTLHEVLAFSCPVPGRVIAAERQRGSTSELYKYWNDNSR